MPMLSSSASKKDETEVVLSHAAIVTKMDRRHRTTNYKANVCLLKENTKIPGKSVLPILTQFTEPLLANNNEWP